MPRFAPLARSLPLSVSGPRTPVGPGPAAADAPLDDAAAVAPSATRSAVADVPARADPGEARHG